MTSIVIGVACAICYLFGVWVGRNKLKSNADSNVSNTLDALDEDLKEDLKGVERSVKGLERSSE